VARASPEARRPRGNSRLDVKDTNSKVSRSHAARVRGCVAAWVRGRARVRGCVYARLFLSAKRTGAATPGHRKPPSPAAASSAPSSAVRASVYATTGAPNLVLPLSPSPSLSLSLSLRHSRAVGCSANRFPCYPSAPRALNAASVLLLPPYPPPFPYFLF
jgi:hypothetical protein